VLSTSEHELARRAAAPEATRASSRRLSILTQREIDDLYGLPRFTEEDRQLYFDLSAAEQARVGAMHTASAKAHFILQFGYFKAKRQFFAYSYSAVQEDLRHLLERHFPGRVPSTINQLSKPTRLEQQQVILNLFNYTRCGKAAKQDLEHKARRIAMRSTQPIYILREMLQYLANRRIVAPGYTVLQDLVTRAVSHERRRVIRLLGQAITPEVEKQLQALLESDEGLYQLTILKHEPKDFSHKELRQEGERRRFFQPLYEFARTFLAAAGLSNDSVRYYASLVEFYTVYKLQRMAVPAAWLYLLCFAYHRLQEINDNLIEAFIHLVNGYERDAKLSAKDSVYQAKTAAAANLKAAGQVLNLFIDPSIPIHTPFGAVQEKAFTLLPREQFPSVTHYIADAEFDEAGFEWAYYVRMSQAFKVNLRHLFSALDFAGRVEDTPLLKAVNFLQMALRQGKTPRQIKAAEFPLGVIPKRLRRYLFTPPDGEDQGRRLEVDRYEFLVYRLLRNALEAGNVFVRDSTQFRRFEDDLISDERWQAKDAMLREIGAPILMRQIVDTLTVLREELEQKFALVNQQIESGANRHIKLRGAGEKRRWTLVYPSEEEPINSPFFGELPAVAIADLLWFVHGQTNFLSAFIHVLDRYVKHEPAGHEILACLIAFGTNMGLWKMAAVSDLGYSSLRATARNYLRPETLHAGNDFISNALARLPMFQHYDIQEAIHSSSDGQRLETQIDTINARFSSKYFGLKKGISSYTLVANHIPINARTIGAQEHESHYVFDVLYNNTTEIKPDRHSTDTHGTNQVNFWILHAFGYEFAPRYRDLHKKMSTLVGFEHPGQYGNALIKPARKVNEPLIRQEWPNVQRIMASLAQKEVTQATIVRKLSAYARQNQTKKALWELDNICRTLYILNFIDNVTLRQSVQKALNRGEAYHRFRRAIAYVNAGKLHVRTEAEQQVWNECARLIANAVIYYNATIASRVLEQKQAAGDDETVELLKGISPVAWQHVNLFGRFEFNKRGKVDLAALVKVFDEPQCWTRITQQNLHEDYTPPI
jgi:TnpA family transposase